jgi:hypothetical protein
MVGFSSLKLKEFHMKSIKVLAVLGVLTLAASYAHAQGQGYDPRYNSGYENQQSANPEYSNPDYSNPNYSNQNANQNYNQNYSNQDYDNPGYAAPDYAGSQYVEPSYGPPPACAYGYYQYYPYACAPAGYYGPTWFSGGVFIGAGPWIHGYGRPGYRGRGYYGGAGIVGRGPGFVGRGPAVSGRAPVGGFRGGNAFRGGAVRGGGSVHGGSSFHGGSRGGGSHGGGSHGGRR